MVVELVVVREPVPVQRYFSFYAFVSVLFQRVAVVVAVVAVVVAIEQLSTVIYMDLDLMEMFETVEAHVFRKDFVRLLDLLVDNSNCHRLNYHRPMNECAYLDRMLVHRNDVEWSVHSIRSVSFDYHLKLLALALKTLDQFDQRCYTIRVGRAMDRTCVCLDAQPLIVVDWFGHHSHVDYNQYALLIYYRVNKVNSLNASMVVGMCSISHLMLDYHFYYQLPPMASEMILKSSW